MYSLLLLNGGIGSRIGADLPKQFLKIRGIPILVYSLSVIDRIDDIGEIVLNFPPGEEGTVEKIITDYAIRTPVVYVEAGATRHESVAKMLQHARFESILIHEAARPTVSENDFNVLIQAEQANVSLMLPIPFTVAPVDPVTSRVTGSLERSTLRNVQLPQKFNKTDLMQAHGSAAREGREFTEDATLVASHGFDVFFVEGSDRNFKVTTPVDLNIASFLLHTQEGEENV